jgi:hypothetical protein
VNTPTAAEPSRKDAATIHRTMPGCGLAVYAGVLLAIMTMGVVAMLLSGLTIVSSSNAARPTRLMYGGDVEPYLLNGLRTVGLLEKAQVPDAFHAEDWTGMAVCALTSTRVLRLGPEGAYSVSIAASTATEVPGGVQIEGPWQPTPTGIDGRPQSAAPGTITCAFEPNDGGDRFVSMLNGAKKASQAP